MRTEWNLRDFVYRKLIVKRHANVQQIHTAHLLWNGWKVAIATQGLFQAHVDAGSK